MNAGCYGGETWESVVEVTTVDRAGVLRVRTPGDYDIGYRHVVKHTAGDEWFVAGTFAFAPGDRATAMARMKALLRCEPGRLANPAPAWFTTFATGHEVGQPEPLFPRIEVEKD